MGLTDILQPTHLLFILVVALVFLGPKRLPEVGRSLGKGMRDFRSAVSGLEEHTSELHSLATVPLNPDPVMPVTPSTLTPAPAALVDDSVATVVLTTPTPVSEVPTIDVAGVEAAASDSHAEVPPTA